MAQRPARQTNVLPESVQSSRCASLFRPWAEQRYFLEWPEWRVQARGRGSSSGITEVRRYKYGREPSRRQNKRYSEEKRDNLHTANRRHVLQRSFLQQSKDFLSSSTKFATAKESSWEACDLQSIQVLGDELCQRGGGVGRREPERTAVTVKEHRQKNDGRWNSQRSEDAFHRWANERLLLPCDHSWSR